MKVFTWSQPCLRRYRDMLIHCFGACSAPLSSSIFLLSRIAFVLRNECVVAVCLNSPILSGQASFYRAFR